MILLLWLHHSLKQEYLHRPNGSFLLFFLFSPGYFGIFSVTVFQHCTTFYKENRKKILQPSTKNHWWCKLILLNKLLIAPPLPPMLKCHWPWTSYLTSSGLVVVRLKYIFVLYLLVWLELTCYVVWWRLRSNNDNLMMTKYLVSFHANIAHLISHLILLVIPWCAL